MDVDLSNVASELLVNELIRRDEWDGNRPVSDFATEELIEELESRGCCPDIDACRFLDALRDICIAFDMNDFVHFAVLMHRIQQDAGISHPSLFLPATNPSALAASEPKGMTP